ncbi:unnamed protein product [Peniophora sp. CBMAI 1063]|nr:unnamed protein product [Peniophora sp. CBMAI 1063]
MIQIPKLLEPSDTTLPWLGALPDPNLTPYRRRTAKELHKRYRGPDYTPRPPNAFLMFRADFARQNMAPGEQNHRNISRIAGAIWRAMDKAQRKPWEVKAGEAMRMFRLSKDKRRSTKVQKPCTQTPDLSLWLPTGYSATHDFDWLQSMPAEGKHSVIRVLVCEDCVS